MKFFNANAMIGAHFGPRLGIINSADDLIQEMDEYKIEEALVYHAMAFEYEYQYGNSQLIEEVKKHDRLHACWIGGLHYLDSALEPKQFIDELLKNNVKTVKIFFDGYLHDSSRIAVNAYEPLFEQLEKHRIPTFIQFGDNSGISPEVLQNMTEVIENHQNLPIIFSFTSTEAKLLNFLYFLLQKYSNCYSETIGIQMNMCLKKYIDGGLGKQLIFSTAYPWCNSAVSKISLAYSEIAESAKSDIAGNNLKRLIKGILL